MKWRFLAFFFLSYVCCFGQLRTASFTAIDWNVQDLSAPTPDSLSSLLTAPYSTNLEKVRAIYSWMVQHISYNTGIYKPRPAHFIYAADPADTASVWKSADEMTAQRVLYRRVAVCEGYARLFKVLCSYAGMEAAVITGYARGDGRSSERFRTNHAWNAVKIDSTWHLLDVTWASGYINFNNEYTASRNDAYFLTPPEQFARDHYPEQLQWSLLPQPPALSEFKKMPFKSKNFIKYGIESYLPLSGTINVSIGDTLAFRLVLKDSKKAKSISPDSFADTTLFALSAYSRFITPNAEKNNDVFYTYIAEPGTEWLHLVYNDDVIMRYRLVVTVPTASVNKSP